MGTGAFCCAPQSDYSLEDKVDERKIISEIKHNVFTRGFAWIDGADFRNLLLQNGATEEDLQAVERGEIHEQVPKDKVPSMSFRQICWHREVITPSGEIQQAGCPGVLYIPKTEVASNDFTEVKFNRTGARIFHMPPKDYEESSVSAAMAKVMSYLNPDAHHYQPHLNIESEATLIDQALVRINKRTEQDFGEPSPEGVHQDGTEISAITMIARRNVQAGGETRIWSLRQPCGNYASQEFGKLKDGAEVPPGFSWDNCKINRPLLNPWETVLFNDRRIKHEARSFIAGPDELGPSHRDVIVTFTRKPLMNGCDTMLQDGVATNINSVYKAKRGLYE